MNKISWFIFVVVILMLATTACGLSQAELDATATQVAADVFATQTAQAPTATSTFTPSPAPTLTSTATEPPTATPTPVDTATATPTSMPGWMAAGLTLDDLPGGFRVMSSQELGPLEQSLPRNALAYGFSHDANTQIVMGYLIHYATRAEQVSFDGMLPDTLELFASAYGATSVPKSITGLDELGESRAGSSFVTQSGGFALRWENIVFRRGEVGSFLFVVYPDGDKPAVPAGDLARILDSRLSMQMLGQAVTPASIWREDFNASLAQPWEWINEYPGRWNLTEKPGFLRIYASSLGTGGENLLLRSVAEGDFTIQARMLFEPDTNFQFAGLVIYQSEGNFLQLGRAFCDLANNCVGNGIYFDKVLGGDIVGGNFHTPVENPLETFLRLERRGEKITGFYSSDGNTWIEVGTHVIPSDFKVDGVGLTASQDSVTTDLEIPADFDFFELIEGE